MAERRKLTYSAKKSFSARKSNLPMSTNRSSNVLQTRPSNISRPSSGGHRLGVTLSATRPSSGTRSSSVTRPSSATRISRDTAIRSSGGLRRYGSDNYLNTPSRFTLSTPLHGRSPGVRRSIMPPDSSRKSKHENILKVQEILQQDEAFFADLNLRNGGLKSMTINQFHMIMDHFVYLITGKDLKTFTPNTNNDMNKKPDEKRITAEGILNFLEQVQYPFTVNKSVLKTPNAPHTFDQIVMMLLWLGDISSISNIAADDALIHQSLLTRDEQFPNEEYTATFSKAMQNGYLLWDKDNDEHDILIKRLTDGLIAAKLDNKVTSEADLQALTEKLKIKSKEFVDNPVQLNNIHQFEQLESKYLEYETKEHDLMNQLRDKRDRLAAVNVLWNDKRAKMQQTQTQIQALAIQIQQQKYNINDYKKLIEQMTLLKAEVCALENEKRLVQDEESNQLIKHARLVKNVSKAITDINNRGMQIIKVLNNSREFADCYGDRELNKLHLPATPSLKQVEQVNQIFSQIYSAVEVQKYELKLELDQAINKLNVLKAESTALAKELQNSREKYDKLTDDYKILEKKAAMKNRKNDNSTRDLCKQADDAKAKLQSLKDEIVAARVKETELAKENAKLMADGEAQARIIIEEKERLADHLDDIDRMLDAKLEGLDYPK